MATNSCHLHIYNGVLYDIIAIFSTAFSTLKSIDLWLARKLSSGIQRVGHFGHFGGGANDGKSARRPFSQSHTLTQTNFGIQ